ncbi:MAG: BrnT family toxin [Treponema sp.]|nr:BrnT family toxin [Treponema sp.]
MENRRIVWDETKNAENKRKHGVSFEVGQYVFADPDRIWRLERSEGNTSGEERWQTVGKVGKLFFVAYTEREVDGVNETRLIMARAAEKPERRSYNGYYRIDNKGWTKDS